MASATSITARSRSDSRRARSGFTLVESMVSMSVGILFMGLILGAVVMQTKFSAAVGNYELMNRTGTVAMRQFESDMRQARTLLSTPSYDNGYDPARIRVEVVTGIDSDGKATRETVEYTYDAPSGTLYREQAGAGRRRLITGLTSCKFSYFGLNDNPLPSAANPTPSPLEVRKVLFSGAIATAGAAQTTSEQLISSIVVMRKPVQ